jgi:hypothetical protein
MKCYYQTKIVDLDYKGFEEPDPGAGKRRNFNQKFFTFFFYKKLKF